MDGLAAYERAYLPLSLIVIDLELFKYAMAYSFSHAAANNRIESHHQQSDGVPHVVIVCGAALPKLICALCQRDRRRSVF